MTRQERFLDDVRGMTLEQRAELLDLLGLKNVVVQNYLLPSQFPYNHPTMPNTYPQSVPLIPPSPLCTDWQQDQRTKPVSSVYSETANGEMPPCRDCGSIYHNTNDCLIDRGQ